MTTLAQTGRRVNPDARRMSALIQRLHLNTAAEIWERDERFRGVQAGTVTTAATPPMLARLNRVIAEGAQDRTPGGPYRMYEGPAGGEGFAAQAWALGEDLAICFFPAHGHKVRRLLVASDPGRPPIYYLHVTGQRIQPHDGEFAEAAKRIIVRRAYEREHGLQRVPKESETAA